jgi:hypothetical protein
MEDLCLDSVNMHDWFWVSWIFCPVSSLMTQAFGLKQVVSQLPFARTFLSLSCFCLLSYLMPRKSLVEVKAHEREQIRLRTERRIAQLRQE